MNKHGLTFDDMGTPMEEKEDEKVELYEDGVFSGIDSPIKFPSGTCSLEFWEKTIHKAGYSKSTLHGSCESPYIGIWSQENLEADCDYPYFIEFNCMWEGRLIFFKKWYHVTHFINNHGAILNTIMLTELLERFEIEEDILDIESDID